MSVEVAFVCAVKIVRWKFEGEDSGARRGYKLDAAVQGLVNQSVCSTEVIDILRVAGIKSPDISVLGEELL